MDSYQDLLRAALAPRWDWRVPCARPVIYLSPIILSLNPHNATTLAHNATGTRGDRRPHLPATPTHSGDHRLGRIPRPKLTRNTEPPTRESRNMTREAEHWRSDLGFKRETGPIACLDKPNFPGISAGLIPAPHIKVAAVLGRIGEGAGDGWLCLGYFFASLKGPPRVAPSQLVDRGRPRDPILWESSTVQTTPCPLAGCQGVVG